MEDRFNNETLEEFLNRPADYENERRRNSNVGLDRVRDAERRTRRSRRRNAMSILMGENNFNNNNGDSPILQQGITVEGYIDIDQDYSSLSSLSDEGDQDMVYSDEDQDEDQVDSYNDLSDSDSDLILLDENFTTPPSTPKSSSNLEMDNLYYSIHNNIISNIYSNGQLTDKQIEYNKQHVDIISNLPYEVLAYIFQSLDVNTLFNISLVSKIFYRVQNSYSVWRPKCKTSNIYNRDLFTMEQSTFYTTAPKILNNSQDENTNSINSTTTTTTTTTSTSPNGYYSPPILSNNSNTTVSDLKSSFMATRTVRLFTDELEPYTIDQENENIDEQLQLNNNSNEKEEEQEEEEEKFEISMCDWKKLYFELGSIKFYGSYDLISNAIESSSCDSPQQTIHNTLVKNDSFWSSKGTPSSHDSEYLVYKLEQPICIISSVKLLAYQASFQSGFPTYAPMGVVISVGFSPNSYHYRSQLFGCKQTDKPQIFNLEPELVIGGYIRIELVGKYQTQFNDKLYYHAINHIGVEGQAIGSLDFKPTLSLSMLHFYSKFKDPSTLVHYSTNNINHPASIDSSVILTNNDNQKYTFNQIISKLRSFMAPKLDKERIKKHNLYSAIQDVVEGRYQEAIKNIFGNDLRSDKVFNIFVQAKDNKAISKYYSTLFESSKKFSHEETMFLAREAFSDSNVNIFTRLLLSNRLKPSSELGEFILMNGYSLIAAEVFSQCQILDRTIQCLFIAGCHEEALIYCRNYSNDYPLDLVHFINLFCQYSTYQGCSFTITLIEFLNQIRNEENNEDLNNFNINNNNNNNNGIQVEADRIGSLFGIEIQDPNDTETLITELKKLKPSLQNIKPPRKTKPVPQSRLSDFFKLFIQVNGSNIINTN